LLEKLVTRKSQDLQTVVGALELMRLWLTQAQKDLNWSEKSSGREAGSVYITIHRLDKYFTSP